MHPMLNIAVRAARRAGTIILRSQARMDTVKVDMKGRRDYVSTTDKEAEAAIMEILLKAYPSHAILAEESGGHGDSDHVWIIDPLDGTTNYLHGFPHFAVSIALQVKGQIELGLIYDPLRDELFTATRGGGALLNDRRLRVARGRDLDHALLGTGFPIRQERLIEPYLKTFETFLRRANGVRRSGSACLDLAYVAAGRLDGYWEYGLKPWDIAAGALMVQEAGGLVGPIHEGHSLLDDGHVLAATTKIFDEMRTLLGPTGAMR
jgi:myo-inositol-1(or 4)-monophosphatase